MNITTQLDQMANDDRFLGFGYLGARSYASPTEREFADTVVDTFTADWTDDELFAWANSKNGRWFADVLFGGFDHSDRQMEIAASLITKVA